MQRRLTDVARSRLRALTVAAILSILVLGPATGAVAFSVNTHLCDIAPDAGFVDVSASSPHKADIDCLRYWGVTNQTGTYDPQGVVTRWQMALFMTRAYNTSFGLYPGTGADQGFTDIAHLTPETQTAINQLKQLSITAGTSATTYEPDGPVNRWQMALFLTRLVRASVVTLPAPSPTGFTDIGDLPQPTQDAISQLKALGITQGTSPATFTPDGLVTREQMASFIVRTLKVTWRFNTLSFATDCAGSTPDVCTDPDTTWVFEPDSTIVLRQGWSTDLPYATPDDRVGFEALEVQYLINGVPVPATQVILELEGVAHNEWVLDLTSSDTPPSFELEVRWIDSTTGEVLLTTILSVAWL